MIELSFQEILKFQFIKKQQQISFSNLENSKFNIDIRM